ncbi:transcriptional regulator [Flavivirga rizhaonensis]|uniref:Uncharacterized protein n=1 Tax=Flavivirga rizhaonensis TaxID=2559571 RepID=A0A4S1E2C8_9FLAO|nr:hypothetical protein [Flavivirga rizhaonensis]TGV04777.1 hypothetical protein EM932_01235 [Flavivirga rizhaonensis]
MKKKDFFSVFIFSFAFFFGFTQSVKIQFDHISNEYKVEKISSSNGDTNILITDNKSIGDPKQFVINKTFSQTTFVNKVVEHMKSVSKSYFFQFKDKITLEIPKEKLKYKDYSFIKPERQTLDKMIKGAIDLNNKDFEEYLTSIATDSSKNIFTKEEHFKFKKNSDNKVEFKNGENTLFIVDNEKNFYDNIYEKFETISDSLKKVLISKEAFNKIASLNVNDSYKISLGELYDEILKDSDYTFISNVVLSYPDNKKDSIYNISVRNNHDLKFYNLKFCNENLECKKSIKILYSSEKVIFKKIVNSFIKKIDTNFVHLNEDYMAELYLLVKAHNEKSIIKDAQKPYNKKIDSLVTAIENLATQYSGKLKLNKTIRVYRKKKPVQDTTFKVDYATLRFFNNKAKEIVVVGQLSNNSREFTVVNYQFSIPLRSFRNSLNFVPISPNDDDAHRLYLNYNDLFEYYPKDESSNYSARNKAYKIKADSTVVIEERKLMDYFTAVVFSDFLGLNNQNSNSILQAEGRIKIPIWIHNWSYFSILHSLYADINATIYNGFDDNSRFITPISVAVDSNDDNILLSATINNFDYIKYNNLNAGLGLDLINLELKGLSTEWSFGYGLRYYRAGLKHTKVEDGVDVVKRYQLNALTHEISTNFEIRPQLNFGADLNVAFNWLNGRGSVENLDILYNQQDDNDKKEVLRLQLNLYSKVNPNESNGGIYARIGGFYHIGAKDFYPQILVGYATNLSSFVNKFTKKE